MHKWLFLCCAHALMAFSIAAHQKSEALPAPVYKVMTESVNSADIVLLQGEGGSIAIDQQNIGFIKDIVACTSGEKINGPQVATIMCLIDGKEYISGNIYMNEHEGSVVFTINDKEYVNQLNEKGVNFLKTFQKL